MIEMEAIPRAPAEALLIHADFLRGLAVALLADRDGADDVCQDTWLAAVRRPPRRLDNPRGWLATVARRLARHGQRGDIRREEREQRAPVPEAVPSADEIAEREEVRRLVVDALMELQPRYRDALVLRFYEELQPREIAARLGIPVETARSRIRRGLERLRKALDERHEGGRSGWMAALLPIASTGGEVVAAGSVAVPGVVTVLAVGLLALLPLLWIAFSDDLEREEEPPRVVRAAAAVEADPVGAGGEVEPTRVQAPTSVPMISGVVSAPDGEPAAGARVFVTGFRIDGISADSPPDEDAMWERHVVEIVQTRPDGSYAVEALPPGVYEIRARGALDRAAAPVRTVLVPPPEGFTFEPASTESDEDAAGREAFGGLASPDAPLRLDLAMVPAYEIAGRVRDEEGKPVAGAYVGALPHATFFPKEPPLGARVRFFGPLLAPAMSAADGSFRIRGVSGQVSLVARAAGHYAASRELAVDGEQVDREIVLKRHPDWLITGTVRDERGRPVGGATITFLEVEDKLETGTPDTGYRTTLRQLLERIDALDRPTTTSLGDGSFAFRSPVPPGVGEWDPPPPSYHGAYRLLARADGHAPRMSEPFTPNATGRPPLSIRLTSTARLGGVVVAADDGSPVAGARVAALFDVEGRHFPALLDECETGRDGRFALDAPSLGAHIRAEAEGFEQFYDMLDTFGGEPLRIELVRTDAPITGQVVGPDGKPVPRFLKQQVTEEATLGTSWFGILALEEDPSSTLRNGARLTLDQRIDAIRAEIADDSTFAIPSHRWPEGQAWIVFAVDGVVREIRSARPGERGVRFVADPETVRRSLGVLTVRARDENRRVLSDGVRVEMFRSGAVEPEICAKWVDGGVVASLVRGGVFDVAVEAAGHGRVTIPEVEVPAGATIGPIDVSLPSESRLRGRARQPEAAVNTGGEVWIQVFDVAGRRVFSKPTLDDGSFEVGGLSAGRYLVDASGLSGRVWRWIDVPPETEVGVELVLTADHPVRLSIVGYADQDLPPLEITVCDAAGRVVFERRERLFPSLAKEEFFLLPGTYHAKVCSPAFGVLERTFQIPAVPGETSVGFAIGGQ